MARFSPTLRGGQNALHNFRMTVQLIRETVWLGLIVSGGIALLYLVRAVPYYDFYVYLKYQWTDILWGFSRDPKAQTTFQLEDGRDVVVYMLDLLRAPEIVDRVEFVQGRAVTAAMIAGGTMLAILVLGFVYFRVRGLTFRQRFEERGAKSLVGNDELRRIVRKRRRTPAKYSIGGVPFPEGAEMRHVSITGTTGAGKTLLLRDLLRQIRDAGDRAVVYDRTGSFVRAFYNPDVDVLLNPLDGRSPAWSPFADASTPAELEQIASVLISEPQHGDKTWAQASRLAFVEGCGRILAQNANATNRDLIKALVMTDWKQIGRKLKGTYAHNVIPEDSPRTAASVLFTNTIGLKALRILPDEPPYFSVRKWIANHNQPGFLFLPSQADQKELLKPLISAWFEIAFNALMAKGTATGRRTWFIVDEMASLEKLPAFQRAPAEIRQFGGCLVFSYQSQAQLRDLYGRDGATTISSTTNTRCIFQTPDADMAELEARTLGEQIYDEYDESLTYGAAAVRDGVGLAERRKKELVVTPGDILYLPELAFYLRFPGDLPVTKVQLDWTEPPQVAPDFLPRTGSIEPLNPAGLSGDGPEIDPTAEISPVDAHQGSVGAGAGSSVQGDRAGSPQDSTGARRSGTTPDHPPLEQSRLGADSALDF